MSGGNPLQKRFIEICQFRDTMGPSCEIREEVWNYLSRNVQGYTPDAEILQAFELFGDRNKKGYGTCEFSILGNN